MKIEWDEDKRQKTLRERGLDFADVALVDWEEAITLPDKRHDYGEDRVVTYAAIIDRLRVIAWCHRGPTLRVFSLRKAIS